MKRLLAIALLALAGCAHRPEYGTLEYVRYIDCRKICDRLYIEEPGRRWEKCIKECKP